MDMDQLVKRVDWLDEERRKDKNIIASMEEQILSMQGQLTALGTENKELSGEVTRLETLLGRLDSIDETIAQQRVELHRKVDEFDRVSEKGDEEVVNLLRTEIKGYDQDISEIRKELDILPELKRGLKARIDEENRLNRSIDEVENDIGDIRREGEELNRIYRLVEDGRRQDSKRLTDIQGEVTALRKRVEEQRGRTDLVSAELRKVETRLTELLAVERERRDAQAAFLEKQALAEVERERNWKEWQTRFETIEGQSADIETQIQALDTTHRSIKRSQTAVDDLMQRVERRINEIVEMQRLAEERFRQEWTTFKADDQKRWTNYTLSQDEQRSEFGRRFDRIADRVTILEDSFQEVQDTIHQMNEHTEKRLQSLLAVVHDWVSVYEKTMAR
jgi:chromosome segregation ATPase